MKYRCKRGRHQHNAPDKADNCIYCRQALDAKVVRYFKQESAKLLKAAAIRD